MTEIEDMGDMKPVEVVPEQAVYVCLYWIKSDYPMLWPMYSVNHNKQDAIKYAVENNSRDPDRPIKLFRLPYGGKA